MTGRALAVRPIEERQRPQGNRSEPVTTRMERNTVIHRGSERASSTAGGRVALIAEVEEDPILVVDGVANRRGSLAREV